VAGEKYTIRRVHVGGRARVHDPGVGVLERHLVQGGNEAGLIPHLRGGDLSRSERGVRLGVGAKEAGRAPALHALHARRGRWTTRPGRLARSRRLADPWDPEGRTG